MKSDPKTFAYTREDFPHSPLLVFYEITRACDLLCKHCRACAQVNRHPNELGTQQAMALCEELMQFPKPPVLVFTGGDPLKRPDIHEVVRHAAQIGLRVAMTPSPTPLVSHDSLRQLMRAGVSRLAISLDGKDAATHDAVRGIPGSFRHTLSMMDWARQLELPVQINTTLTTHNLDQIDAIAELLAKHGIAMWSLFFLVPVGRARPADRVSAEQMEQAFARLHFHAQRQPYAIKTTEAPHYRRYLMQQDQAPAGVSFYSSALAAQLSPIQTSRAGQGPGAPPLVNTNDGRGVMFVSHVGHIYPSGFLPILCGRFPIDSVVDTYQKSEVFLRLRDVRQLKGKCGVCEYRGVCGGSRARAMAVCGDYLASEPDCAYVPSAWTKPAGDAE